jgi:hypothetical protein
MANYVEFNLKYTKEYILKHLWEYTIPYENKIWEYAFCPLLTIEKAREILENNDKIDYIYGKPIKVDFTTFPILRSNEYNMCAGYKKMEKLSKELDKKMI